MSGGDECGPLGLGFSGWGWCVLYLGDGPQVERVEGLGASGVGLEGEAFTVGELG